MNKSDFLEKLVFNEVAGKNNAIHSYDEIIWKIRTGYLTLLFAAWAIILKNVVDSTKSPHSNYGMIVIALFLFSLGLALGGWFIDMTYVRRKERVILALDDLTEAIEGCKGNFLKIPTRLLKVAGDKPDMPYDSKGYQEAYRGSIMVFFIPLLAVMLAAGCILFIV
jgi:hypothetical protein